MKINDVRNAILDKLSPFAVNNGFKVIKGRFALERNVSGKKDAIWFTYNSWGDEIHLFPYVSVDFSSIKSICSLCGFSLNYCAFINLLLFRLILTVGFNPDIRWQMQVANEDRIVVTEDSYNPEDVYNQVNNLLEYAIGYFNQISAISDVDRIYNERPISRYNPNCSGLDTHCFIGLISAWLSKNPDYDYIEAFYKTIIEKEDLRAETKSAFRLLIELLHRP